MPIVTLFKRPDTERGWHYSERADLTSHNLITRTTDQRVTNNMMQTTKTKQKNEQNGRFTCSQKHSEWWDTHSTMERRERYTIYFNSVPFVVGKASTSFTAHSLRTDTDTDTGALKRLCKKKNESKLMERFRQLLVFFSSLCCVGSQKREPIFHLFYYECSTMNDSIFFWLIFAIVMDSRKENNILIVPVVSVRHML